MADRFSQMSEQAALIARKKAEIEAKRLAALETGSVEGYSHLESSNNSNAGSKGNANKNYNPANVAALKNKW
jgi:hypothetical protein